MSGAHTPGPWGMSDVRYRRDSAEWRNIVGDGKVVAVASAESYDGYAFANAQLIAAAPCLLAALEEARSCVDELCFGQDPANECWQVLARVDAAIAKATGGAK